ncbi:hypothetical protein U9316_28250, partial [Escherichia coli]
MFSHPVYLFLRKFSLQDSRGGSVGYPKYYQTADYALRLSVMADIATMRMKALHFWDKHGISAAS